MIGEENLGDVPVPRVRPHVLVRDRLERVFRFSAHATGNLAGMLVQRRVTPQQNRARLAMVVLQLQQALYEAEKLSNLGGKHG